MSYLSWLTPPSHPLVFGHHDSCVVVVVLQTAVSSILQQGPHRLHVAPTTGTVQSRVATVRLAVYVTAILNQRKKRTIKTCLSRREHKGVPNELFSYSEGSIVLREYTPNLFYNINYKNNSTVL